MADMIPISSINAGEIDSSIGSPHEPPRWLWLGVPLALFAALLVLGVRDDSDPAYIHRWWVNYLTGSTYPFSYENEFGVVELATPAASALGVIAGIAALRHRPRLPTPWLRGWVVLVTLGCVYITGEELSWGQYLFGWDAPLWWPSRETNLHSVNEADSAYWLAGLLLNEGPRLLLELFVFYGGIIRVLVVKRGDWRIWLWPTGACLPSALLAILARLPDRLDWLGFGYAPLLFDNNLINWQSLQELFFALFLSLYLLSLRYRLSTPGRTSKN